MIDKRLIWGMIVGLVLFNNVNCYAAGKTIEAFKNNNYTGTSDCQEMINGIKSQNSSYTSTYKKSTSSITRTDFTRKTKAIKYWASHGSNYGKLWGDSGVSINIMNLNNFKWSGSNLEFVFLAACNQLDGANQNPRAKYANAMLGSNAVRVICGYHEAAPKTGTNHDAAVARNFIAKAKTGESVKSSWIQANQIYGSSNYCVLTHAGNVQYSRFEGFPGATYARPGESSKSILRFSAANPSGTNQTLSRAVSTLMKNESIPTYRIKAINRDVRVDSKAETTVLKLDDYVTTQNNEISSTKVKISEKTAKQYADQWLDSVFVGIKETDFDDSFLSIKPIVMAEVDLNGNIENEIETCVAYDITFNRTYNGIPVEGDKYCAIVDDNGVLSSALCLRDYVIVDAASSYVLSKFEDNGEISKQLKNKGLKLDETIQNASIEFTDADGDGIYDPTIIIETMDDKIVNINYFTKKIDIY